VDEQDGDAQARHVFQRRNIACLELRKLLRPCHGGVPKEMPRQLDDPALVVDGDGPKIGEGGLSDNPLDARIDGGSLDGDRGAHRCPEQRDGAHVLPESFDEVIDRRADVELLVVPVSAVRSTAVPVTAGIVEEHVVAVVVEELRKRDARSLAVSHPVEVHNRAPSALGLSNKPA